MFLSLVSRTFLIHIHFLSLSYLVMLLFVISHSHLSLSLSFSPNLFSNVTICNFSLSLSLQQCFSWRWLDWCPPPFLSVKFWWITFTSHHFDVLLLVVKNFFNLSSGKSPIPQRYARNITVFHVNPSIYGVAPINMDTADTLGDMLVVYLHL